MIAVGSGKGGVGKSTVSKHLATLLATDGKQVGLIDADIYGPSQSGLFGVKGAQCEINAANKIIPIYHQGVYFVSGSSLFADDKPMIWRAPMATRLITDFIKKVEWPELDYLILDLPPGTGDIQLTIAQQSKLTGAVIVTTPQRVAYEIAEKAIQMFVRVNVPIIGIVENMSGYICQHCGEENHIFRQGGAEKMAKKYDVDLLASIPLDATLVDYGDDGKSIMDLDDSHIIKQCYDKLCHEIVERTKTDVIAEVCYESVQDNQYLSLVFPDEKPKLLPAYTLRTHCQCANCIDEVTGKKRIGDKGVALNIKITNIHETGRYGLKIGFSDGHHTGIYTFGALKALSEQSTSVVPEFEV